MTLFEYKKNYQQFEKEPPNNYIIEKQLFANFLNKKNVPELLIFCVTCLCNRFMTSKSGSKLLITFLHRAEVNPKSWIQGIIFILTTPSSGEIIKD